MASNHVLIVGAGVLGLSCAIQLSRSSVHDKVTVIARDLPGDTSIDYASPWAGAHFRPSPAKTATDQFEQQLMRETYTELEHLAEAHPEAGVRFVPAIEYFDSADENIVLAKENGYIDWPDFRLLRSDEYPANAGGHDAGEQSPIRLGVSYRGWILNSPLYLEWCRRVAERQGVVFIRASVTSMADAVSVFRRESRADEKEQVVRAVINATGRGIDDPDSFPSRGQFIIVSNPCDRTISHHWADGSSTVIVPRPLGGGTVIGGTKEPGNWSEDISDEATEAILKRVAAICPEMVDGQTAAATAKTHGFHIRQVYVARRPMRRGGLRLEKETMEGGTPLIHCYGAGASGFKVSWGVAKHVEVLVREIRLASQ